MGRAAARHTRSRPSASAPTRARRASTGDRGFRGEGRLAADLAEVEAGPEEERQAELERQVEEMLAEAVEVAREGAVVRPRSRRLRARSRRLRARSSSLRVPGGLPGP